jgi:hypothetical protein
MAILRGEWKITHQGVAFTKDGTLIDGQHRLMAIDASNTPCEMLCVTGLEPDCFMVIDSGVKRSISDLTGLEKRSAEVCRLIAKMAFTDCGMPTAQIVLDTANSGIDEIHGGLMDACRTTLRYFSSAPMRAAAIALILLGHDKDYVYEQYANMVYQSFDKMTPIMQSLVRQVNRESMVVPGHTHEVFARGVKAMSPKYKSLSVMRLSDDEIKQFVKEFRDAVISCVELSKPMDKAA